MLQSTLVQRPSIFTPAGGFACPARNRPTASRKAPGFALHDAMNFIAFDLQFEFLRGNFLGLPECVNYSAWRAQGLGCQAAGEAGRQDLNLPTPLGQISYCSPCKDVTIITGCGKTRSGEGYGLQPVHKPSGMSRALQAAEKLGTEGGGGFNPRIKPTESAGFSPGRTRIQAFIRSLFNPGHFHAATAVQSAAQSAFVLAGALKTSSRRSVPTATAQ